MILQLQRSFLRAGVAAVWLVFGSVVFVVSCRQGHEVSTRVELEVIDAKGERPASVGVRFLAGDTTVARGEWNHGVFVAAGGKELLAGWGREVIGALVESTGDRPVLGPVEVERVRSRVGTGGHPSVGSILVETFVVRGRLFLTPRLDADEVAFHRFASQAPERTTRARAVVALGGFQPSEGALQEQRLVDGALAVLDLRAPTEDDFEAWLQEALEAPEALRRRAASMVVAESSSELQGVALKKWGAHVCGPGIGLSAWTAIADLREVEEERLAILVRGLAHPDASCRRVAARGLLWTTGRMPAAVKAALVDASRDPDAETRWMATLALAERGGGQELEVTLREMLSAASPFVRSTAAMALVRELKVRTPSAALVAALEETAADPRRNNRERSGAQWALARLE